MNIRNLHTLCLALAIACTLAGSIAAEAKPRYITYEKFGAKGDGVTDDMPTAPSRTENNLFIGLL